MSCRGSGWRPPLLACLARVLEQPATSCSRTHFTYADHGDRNCACATPGSHCDPSDDRATRTAVASLYRVSAPEWTPRTYRPRGAAARVEVRPVWPDGPPLVAGGFHLRCGREPWLGMKATGPLQPVLRPCSPSRRKTAATPSSSGEMWDLATAPAPPLNPVASMGTALFMRQRRRCTRPLRKRQRTHLLPLAGMASGVLRHCHSRRSRWSSFAAERHTSAPAFKSRRASSRRSTRCCCTMRQPRMLC